MDATRRRAALVAGALAITALAYLAGRSTSPSSIAPSSNAPGAAASAPPAAAANAATSWTATSPGPTTFAPGAPGPIAIPSGSTAITIPFPARLGGGIDVPAPTREIAKRLGLVPEELQDLALARGGSLPGPVVKGLDDAYGRGMKLAQRLNVDPQKDDLVGNRFANQLLRIDREMRRSPPGTKLDDVIAAVTRDTLEDLSRNLGPAIADAAKPELAATRPLPAE